MSKSIQYVSNDKGKATAVLVPIELWQEIASERETAYLLRSATMKRRLSEARRRKGGPLLEEVAAKFLPKKTSK